MKQITNGTGEALYVDSSRPIDSLMTVINPTPIDAQLSATKTELKTEMYELSGLQQMSFDKENLRSAAAVIAADQMNDTVFQAQMDGMATFVKDLFKIWVNYNATIFNDPNASVEWKDVRALLDSATLDLKPVHVTNPLGSKAIAEGVEPDYVTMSVARTIVKILRKQVTYDTLSFIVDKNKIKVQVALTMVKMEALNIDIPDCLYEFIIAGFIDDIKQGVVKL